MPYLCFITDEGRPFHPGEPISLRARALPRGPSQRTVQPGGFFVRVPIDYDDLSKGTTDIYAFFPLGFDPQRPTAVFFTGGPGFPAHGDLYRSSAETLAQTGYNMMFFDQRGLGCSRPQSYQVYSAFDFYSSTATAKDAESIRRHLGIRQWSVVGSSYGTIPATIHAHLFPNSTRSATLISPIIGEEKSSHYRDDFMDRIVSKPNFQSLFKGAPDKNIYLGLYRALNEFLYYEGTANLKQFLDNIDQVYPRLNQREPLTLPLSTEEILTSMDLYVTKILQTKDNYYSHFKASPGTFLSKDYPLAVPVTFIQGSGDPRTPESGTLRLFDMASAPAQMLSIRGAGHHVARARIRRYFADETALEPTPYPIPVDILRSALDGRIETNICHWLLLGHYPGLLLTKGVRH